MKHYSLATTYTGTIVTASPLPTYARLLGERGFSEDDKSQLMFGYFNDVYQLFLREFVQLTAAAPFSDTRVKRLHKLLDELVKIRQSTAVDKNKRLPKSLFR